MILETLNKLYKRDLNKLKSEIESYKDESNIWKIDGSVSNTAGNLCLHMVGNLNAYIGAELGNSGYVRQRDKEFSLKDVPRSELIQQVEDTVIMIEATFFRLNEEDLDKDFPLHVFKEPMTTGYFLVHLATHLTYHLGQLNYHRRLLD